jgi:hypothetical protein
MGEGGKELILDFGFEIFDLPAGRQVSGMKGTA